MRCETVWINNKEKETVISQDGSILYYNSLSFSALRLLRLKYKYSQKLMNERYNGATYWKYWKLNIHTLFALVLQSGIQDLYWYEKVVLIIAS